MKLRKKELARFLLWMRNGIAIGTCWLMILWLIYNNCYGVDSMSTETVTKLFGFVAGGTFLFCIFFSSLCIPHWRFVYRLTGFVVAISIYECYGFYELGIFTRVGSMTEWVIFAGIVLLLYLICIMIFQLHSRKKGELYTKALKEYQNRRSVKENE